MAEAAKVDLTVLQDGILQLRSPTLKHAFPVAQSICNRKLTQSCATSILPAMHFFRREDTNYIVIYADSVPFSFMFEIVYSSVL